MMSDYKVEMVNDGMSEFYVEFHGPRESTFFHFLNSLLSVADRMRNYFELCKAVCEADARCAVLNCLVVAATMCLRFGCAPCDKV